MSDSTTRDGVIKLLSLTIDAKSSIKGAWSLKMTGSPSDASFLSGSTSSSQSPYHFASPSYILPINGSELQNFSLCFEFSAKTKVLARIEGILEGEPISFSKSSTFTRSTPSFGTVTMTFQLYGPTLMSYALRSSDSTLVQAAINDLSVLLNVPQQASTYASSAPIIQAILKITSSSVNSKRLPQSEAQDLIELWRLFFQPSIFMACAESVPNMVLLLLDTLIDKPKKVFSGNLELKASILDLTKPLLDTRIGSSLLPVLSALLQLFLQYLPQSKPLSEEVESKKISDRVQLLVSSLIRLLAFYDPKRIPSMIKAGIILPCAYQILQRWKKLNATLLTSLVELFKFFGKSHLQALKSSGLVDMVEIVSNNCNDVRLQLMFRKALDLVCPNDSNVFSSLLETADKLTQTSDRRMRLSLMNYIDSIIMSTTLSPEAYWTLYLRIISLAEPTPSSGDNRFKVFNDQELEWLALLQKAQKPTFEMLLNSDFFNVLVATCCNDHMSDVIKTYLLRQYVSLRPKYPNKDERVTTDHFIPPCISNGFISSKTTYEISGDLLELLNREKAVVKRTRLFHRLIPTNLFKSLDLTPLLLILWHTPPFLEEVLEEDPFFLQKIVLVLSALKLTNSCQRACFVLSCLLFHTFTDQKFEFISKTHEQSAFESFKEEFCSSQVPAMSSSQWTSFWDSIPNPSTEGSPDCLKSMILSQNGDSFVLCLYLLFPTFQPALPLGFVSSEGLTLHCSLFMSRIQDMSEKSWQKEIMDAEASEAKTCAENRLTMTSQLIGRIFRIYFSDIGQQTPAMALLLNLLVRLGLNSPSPPHPTNQIWLSMLVEQATLPIKSLWNGKFPLYPTTDEHHQQTLISGSSVEGIFNLARIAFRGLAEYVKTSRAAPANPPTISRTETGWTALVEHVLERGYSAFKGELMAERTYLRDLLYEGTGHTLQVMSEKLSASLLSSSVDLLEQLHDIKEEARLKGKAPAEINPKLISDIEVFHSSPPSTLWKMFTSSLDSNFAQHSANNVKESIRRLYTTLSFGRKIFPRLALAILSHTSPSPNIYSDTSAPYQTSFSFFCNRISRLAPSEIESNAELLDSLMQVFYVPHLISWSSPIYQTLKNYLAWAMTAILPDTVAKTLYPIGVQAVEQLLDLWLMLPIEELPKNLRIQTAPRCTFITHFMKLMLQPSEILAKKAALLLHRYAYFATPSELYWYYKHSITPASNHLMILKEMPSFKYLSAMSLVCKFLAKIGSVRLRCDIATVDRPIGTVLASAIAFMKLSKSLVDLRKDPPKFLSQWISETKNFHEVLQFIDTKAGQVRSQRPIPLYDIIEKALQEEHQSKINGSGIPSSSHYHVAESSNGVRGSSTNDDASSFSDNAFEGFSFNGLAQSKSPVPTAAQGSPELPKVTKETCKFKIPPAADYPGRDEWSSTSKLAQAIGDYLSANTGGSILDARMLHPSLSSLHSHIFLIEELPLRSDNPHHWTLPGFMDGRALLTNPEHFSLSASNLQFDRYFHSILDDDAHCFLEFDENSDSIRNALQEKLSPKSASDQAHTSLLILASDLPSEIYRNDLFGYFGTLVSSSPHRLTIQTPSKTESPSSSNTEVQWKSNEIIAYATEALTRHLLDALQALNELLYYWSPTDIDRMLISTKDSIVDWANSPPNASLSSVSMFWNLSYVISFVEILNGPFNETPIFDQSFETFDQKKFVGKKWKKAVSLDLRYKFRPYIPVSMYWIWLGTMARYESFLPPYIRTVCGRIAVALIKNDVETGLTHYRAIGEPLFRAVAAFGNFTTIPYFNHLAPRLFPKKSSKSENQGKTLSSTLPPLDTIVDPVDRIEEWYEPLVHETSPIEGDMPPRPSNIPSSVNEPSVMASEFQNDPTAESGKRKKVKPAEFRFTQVKDRILPSYLAAYLPLFLSEVGTLAKQLSPSSKRTRENYEQSASEFAFRFYLELVPLMVKDHIIWCAEGTAQVLVDAWSILDKRHRSPQPAEPSAAFLTSMTTALSVLVQNASGLLRLMSIKPTNQSLWTKLVPSGFTQSGEIGTSFRDIFVGLFYMHRVSALSAGFISVGAMVRLIGVLDPNFSFSDQSLSSINAELVALESNNAATKLTDRKVDRDPQDKNNRTTTTTTKDGKFSSRPLEHPLTKEEIDEEFDRRLRMSGLDGHPMEDDSGSSSSAEIILTSPKSNSAKIPKKEKKGKTTETTAPTAQTSDQDPDQNLNGVAECRRANDTREVVLLRTQVKELLSTIFAPHGTVANGGPLSTMMDTIGSGRLSTKWFHLITPALPFLMAEFDPGRSLPSNTRAFRPETSHAVIHPIFTAIVFAHPLAASSENRLNRAPSITNCKPMGVETAVALRFTLPRLVSRTTLTQYLLPESAYYPGFGKSLEYKEGNMKSFGLMADRTTLRKLLQEWTPHESFMFLVASLAFMPDYTLPTKLGSNAKISHMKQIWGLRFVYMYDGSSRNLRWTSLEKAYNGIQAGRALLPSFIRCNGNSNSLWLFVADNEVMVHASNIPAHPVLPTHVSGSHWLGVSILDRVQTIWIDNSPIYVCGGDPNDPLYPRPNTVQFESPQVQSLLRHYFMLFNLSLSPLPTTPKNVRVGYATKEAIQLLSTSEYALCGIGDIANSWGVCSSTQTIFREGSAQRMEVEFEERSAIHPPGAYFNQPISTFYDPITNSFCVKAAIGVTSRQHVHPKSVTTVWVHLPNDRSLTLYPCVSFYSTRRFLYWSETKDRTYETVPKQPPRA